MIKKIWQKIKNIGLWIKKKIIYVLGIIVGTGILVFSITVLTIHSHPQEGDLWRVTFETKGIGHLRISPADQPTIDDLDFISLKCGDKVKTPQILEGDIIYFPFWFCTKEAEIVHLVNKAAPHHLIFQFGNKTAEAFNNPFGSTSGLVGYWTFDNGDMNWVGNTATVFDISGFGNHGTTTNMTATSSVNSDLLPGQALIFDGINDYILINNAILTAAPMTVCLWGKANISTADLTVFNIADTAGSADAFELNFGGSVAGDPIRWFARRSFSSTAETTIGFTSGQWHFLCGVEQIGGTSRDVYIDAGGKDTNTNTAVPLNLDITTIGVRKRNTESQYFNGLIDEVRIYNRALSADEIAELYYTDRRIEINIDG